MMMWRQFTWAVAALAVVALAALLVPAGCKPADNAPAAPAAKEKEKSPPPTEQDIINLADVRFSYLEDVDEHVTDADSPHDATLVERVMSEEAVPLLIAHLADTRRTWSVYVESQDDVIQVPLGYVCLDILLAMSAPDSRVFAPEGAEAPASDESGFWSDVRPEFVFEPSVLWDEDTAAARMRGVQQAWQRAQFDGNLKFDPNGTEYALRMPYRE